MPRSGATLLLLIHNMRHAAAKPAERETAPRTSPLWAEFLQIISPLRRTMEGKVLNSAARIVRNAIALVANQSVYTANVTPSPSGSCHCVDSLYLIRFSSFRPIPLHTVTPSRWAGWRPGSLPGRDHGALTFTSTSALAVSLNSSLPPCNVVCSGAGNVVSRFNCSTCAGVGLSGLPIAW